MVAKSGTVRNPRTNKDVSWTLAMCLQREAAVAESMGITVYSIGNADHLDNVPAGGHTPFRAGSVVGTVWAIDVMVDHKGAAYAKEFEKFVVAYCKSNVDTTWIRFFNVNGSQYNYAGTRLRASGDVHFHLEVEDGKQFVMTRLMAAWKAFKAAPTTPQPPAAFARVGAIDTARLKQISGDPKVWLAAPGKKAHVKSPEELKAIQAFMKTRGIPSSVEVLPNPIPGTEV